MAIVELNDFELAMSVFESFKYAFQNEFDARALKDQIGKTFASIKSQGNIPILNSKTLLCLPMVLANNKVDKNFDVRKLLDYHLGVKTVKFGYKTSKNSFATSIQPPAGGGPAPDFPGYALV